MAVYLDIRSKTKIGKQGGGNVVQQHLPIFELSDEEAEDQIPHLIEDHGNDKMVLQENGATIPVQIQRE